ncbi:alanine/ornithine racemase family PLP-dependent enzyme [Zhenpiania hominis]|uniref:alanine/ornithine racemase family PLP-dependent enzyme n=1 Tax=Zhenpiania hominis TaxID=2763644 RepID=UPI0039F4E261
MNKNRYPKLVVDLKKLQHNIDRVLVNCQDQGVEVAGVIKGCSGLPECAKLMAQEGCRFIASSRLDQIEAVRNYGVQADFMLIRVPMLSEAADVVRLTEISLNSEAKVLRALNHQAGLQDKQHKVILMVDLGDLREGFWDREELMEAALCVENNMHNLELAGVGTNLGCYGGIDATVEKLNELVECAEAIEEKIGRELEFVAGGSTTSYPRVLEKNMPRRINLLRIGEAMLLARDLQDFWGCDMSDMHRDVFTLQAEVIEAREKPTYPVGKIMYDAFERKPEFEDRGIRKRALIALGRADFAFPDMLIPRDKNIHILGASSDHTILDVQDCQREYKVGDIIEFDLCYSTIVYVTNSPNVDIVYV